MSAVDTDTSLSRPGASSEATEANPPVADSSASIWRRVRRDVVVLGVGNICIVVAQLGFRGILITSLVPASYGRLSLILSLYNTIYILGASGLPNSAARYIAMCSPADDAATVRAAVRAAIWPTVVPAVIIAAIAGVLLKSPLACLFAAIGLSSLVYSLLTTGILRGRGRVTSAATIMPVAAFGEVSLLALVWFSGVGVTPLSAFGLFCAGNALGLVVGIFFTIRTSPSPAADTQPDKEMPHSSVPTARTLLSASLWLGAATLGVALMPLVMRFAAALASYAVVAQVDVALVLLSIPQRVGTVLVSAVVPHATRALSKGKVSLTISRREHVIIIAPFVLGAIIVAFTPIVGWVFASLGRPGYAKGADYLALALLAGPARILYGLVQGILVAHGEGRFLARNSLSITIVASAIIFVAAALGSTLIAFVVFVVACWAVYLQGLARIEHLTHAAGSLQG